MSDRSVCPENELHCRSRQRADLSVISVANSRVQTADEDRLREELCYAEVQHLQDVKPIPDVKESDNETNAFHNR